jgi:hypothetical protein
MIKIGKKSECEMTYEDAVMYCFCLGEGWRLPNESEYWSRRAINGWYIDRCNNPLHRMEEKRCVVPVRDLKDD